MVELICSTYHSIILQIMLIRASFIGLARTILSTCSIIMVFIHHPCIIVASFNNWDYGFLREWTYHCRSMPIFREFIFLIIMYPDDYLLIIPNRIGRILKKKRINISLLRDVWNTLYSILVVMIPSTIADGSMTRYWIRNSQNLLFNKHS